MFTAGEMGRSIFRFFVLSLLAGFTFLTANSQTQFKNLHPQKTRILFIFDASQSMFGTWQSGMKIDVAKKLMSNLMDSLSHVENIEMALRVYGHQSPVRSKTDRNCQDTKLEVPFSGDNNARAIRERIRTIDPKGTTLIAYSLEQSKNDFPPCKNCRNIIVLITDGIEECEGDPCAVSAALQKNNIILKPFIIGIGLGDAVKTQFDCIGNYYNAMHEEAFVNALNVVISQALNNTTVQVNLLDVSGKANETNVAMSFFDTHSGINRYNLMHTMNDRGVPDTISIDPLGTYRLVVHTVPPVTKDSIKLTPGIHNIIAVDAPQGMLNLKINPNNEYKALKAIVRKKGQMQTLNVQEFNSTHKYIVGKYDLEILTLPRIYVNNVDISQSHTTTLEVPQPGMVTIQMQGNGYGSILVQEKDDLKWVCNIDEGKTNQLIVLQPGNYKAVYRAKNARQTIYSIEKEFKIDCGSSVVVRLY